MNQFNDPRITYHENATNIGGHDLVAQWNHSMKFASGQFLIMAADDDTYHPRYLEKMSDLIEKYPDCNVYRCRRQIICTESGHALLENQTEEYISADEARLRAIGRRLSTGLQQNIFRRECLIRIGGFISFPSAWLADDAIVLLMADNGIATHPDTLFCARISDISITGKKNNRSTLIAKLHALSDYTRLISQIIPTIAPSRQLSEAVDIHMNFRSLHIYNLMLNSRASAVIGASWYIISTPDIPVYHKIKYLCKWGIKQACVLQTSIKKKWNSSKSPEK